MKLPPETALALQRANARARVREFSADIEAIRVFINAGPFAEAAAKAWDAAAHNLVQALEEYAAAWGPEPK